MRFVAKANVVALESGGEFSGFDSVSRWSRSLRQTLGRRAFALLAAIVSLSVVNACAGELQAADYSFSASYYGALSPVQKMAVKVYDITPGPPPGNPNPLFYQVMNYNGATLIMGTTYRHAYSLTKPGFVAGRTYRAEYYLETSAGSNVYFLWNSMVWTQQ